MIMMLMIMVVMYIFMFLPQIRKNKKQKNWISELKKGDKVVTTGGVHAKIASVSDTHFMLELEQGKMKVDRSAVSMDLSMAHYGNSNKETKEEKESKSE